MMRCFILLALWTIVRHECSLGSEIFVDYVIGISPDSQKILLLERRDLRREEGKLLLYVKGLTKNEIIFEKNLEDSQFRDALWVSNSEIIIFFQNDSAYLINFVSNKEREMVALRGIFPKGIHMDYESGSLLFADIKSSNVYSKNPKADLCKYQLEKEILSRHTFNANFGWLFDIAVLTNDTLLLNYEGYLALADLSTRSIENLNDFNNQKINLGESKINLTKDKSKCIFSLEDKEIVSFDLNTQKIRKVSELEGYIYPILSPDESFLIVENFGPTSYQAIKIDAVSLLHN